MSKKSRKFATQTLTAAYRGISTYRPPTPPPAALIEARRAQEMAAAQPLAYAFGDPLPGRSALDKMKREGRAP